MAISFVFFFHAPNVFASTGFLGGPMWIDPEVPLDGDSISLSSLFHNAEPNELTGEVVFYDGNVLLGKKPVTISSGGVATATVSFRISSGDHKFSATIGNLFEISSSGKKEPFALSPQTVQLPSIFVQPKAGSSLNASVVPGTSNSVTNNYFSSGGSQISPSNPLAPVVNQVNQLKGDVLSSIPSSVTSPVTGAVLGVDSWREDSAGTLAQSAKSSSDVVAKQKKLIDAEQKKYGKVSPVTSFINRPFAYVKLFFYTLLSYFFGHPFVFYGAFAVIIFLIGKSVFGRMLSRGGKKSTQKSGISKIKKPRFED